jgi:hypothetical protein
MDSCINEVNNIDIDRDGLLVHMTHMKNLASIVKYGLVVGSHFHPVKTAEYERSYYDPVKNGCPCGQLLPQENNENRRNILFFSVIGTMFRGRRTDFNGDRKPYVERDFGILIEPENFIKGLSIVDLKTLEYKAFIGDKDADRLWGRYSYYRNLNLEIQWHLKGREDWEYVISSCVPWNTFSALVVPHRSQHRKQNLDAIVGVMEKERPQDERKPIYDDTGKLLYAI